MRAAHLSATWIASNRHIDRIYTAVRYSLSRDSDGVSSFLTPIS